MYVLSMLAEYFLQADPRRVGECKQRRARVCVLQPMARVEVFGWMNVNHCGYSTPLMGTAPVLAADEITVLVLILDATAADQQWEVKRQGREAEVCYSPDLCDGHRPWPRVACMCVC
jgi:hypothetical protein